MRLFYRLLGALFATLLAAPLMAQTLYNTTHDAEARSYYAFSPYSSRCTPTTARHPLVMLLHGGQGDGTDVMGLINMRLARNTPFVIVYPNSVTGDQWSDGRLGTEGHDDVGFLSLVIDEEVTRHCVDPAQVYMAGISNGGMMTLRVMCDAPELLRGAGIVAAKLPLPLEPTCTPALGVPAAFFDGTDDPLSQFEGGALPGAEEGDGSISQADTRALFSEAYGCTAFSETAMPNKAADGMTTIRQRYTACDDPTVLLDFYVIDGGGHAWPGIGGSGTTKDINATTLMLELWKQSGLTSSVGGTTAFGYGSL